MIPSGEEPFRFETFEEQLANLPAGRHLCHLYQTPAEQLGALVPFCREGIRRRQQCVYFAPASGAQELLRSLRASGMPRAKSALERGQLVAVTTRDAYVRDGRFSPHAMLEYLRALAVQAERDNYAGLRVAGQMDWVLQPDVESDAYLLFEGPLQDEFVTQTGSSVLCQYDQTQFRAEIIHGMLRTHPLMVIGAYVIDNPYGEPEALIKEPERDREERRVEWMLTHLQEKTRRGIAVADLERWALSGVDPGDLMKAATHLVAFELKASLAETFELEPVDNTLHLVADVGWRRAPLDGAEIWGSPTEMFAQRLKPGQPLIVSDWRDDGRFKPPDVFGPDQIRSSAVVAISTLRDQHLHGLLGVHFNQPRTFSEDEIAFLERVAAALAHAISRTRGEEQFRTLVEHVPDVIVRFDAEYRIVYANPALEAIAAAAPDSFKGKTMREVGLPEPLTARWELALERAFRTDREETIDFTLDTPQGRRSFQGRIVPERRLPHGRVQSLMLIARDLTDQRRAESEWAKVLDEVLAQQSRLQELVSRLVEDREHTVQRLGDVIRIEQLTERERQILQLLAEGLTNRDIAPEVGLTVGTVKNHVARIFEKLGVRDRTQAAVLAVQLGLVNAAN